jgi:hypothetical protein
MFSKALKISVLSAAMATLAACGGGGGGGSSTPTYTSTAVNGVAVDFYLKDATISFSNPNCAPIKTDAQGQFKFNTTENCQASEMIITGGTDIGTGLPFTGRLQLKNTDFNQANKVAVTPLTTLEKHLVDAGQQDQLAKILENLGITDEGAKDLSSFNPVTDGSAHTAAASFALQQLVNKIEDNLENFKVDGNSAFSANDAAQIAFLAVIDIVKEKPLFKEGAINFDESTLNSVLDQAFTAAEGKLDDVIIPNNLINDIAADANKLSGLLDTLVKQGGDAEQLLAELQKPENQDAIQDVIKQPETGSEVPVPHYGNFSLAGYSVIDVKNSTQDQPILLDLKDIDTSLEFNFGIKDTTTALNDSFKLGFNVTAASGERSENLQVILDEVQVSFDKTGKIASATIPQDTLVTVRSSMAFPIPGSNASTSYIQTQSPRQFSISNNRNSISLSQLLNSDDRLTSAYNNYKDYLKSGSTVSSQVFIAPTQYKIDSALGLTEQSMQLKINDKNYMTFIAPSLNAYFKLK